MSVKLIEAKDIIPPHEALIFSGESKDPISRVEVYYNGVDADSNERVILGRECGSNRSVSLNPNTTVELGRPVVFSK